MAEQILLNSSTFGGMREMGGFGQPLHALYPQIRKVLNDELGPEAANLLAEPVVDRAKNRIDWYTQGDADQPRVLLNALPEEQRQAILARVHALLERAREVAQRYVASDDPRRAQLGVVLQAALSAPAETEVFVIEERPVMIRWGFTLDGLAQTLPDAGQGVALAPSVSDGALAGRDVAIPDIALPAAATLPSASPPNLDPTVHGTEPAMPARQPALAESTAPGAPEPPSARRPETTALAPPATGPTELEPESPVRRRSFWPWGLLALLLLLAILAYWWLREPAPSWPAPVSGSSPAADSRADGARTAPSTPESSSVGRSGRETEKTTSAIERGTVSPTVPPVVDSTAVGRDAVRGERDATLSSSTRSSPSSPAGQAGDGASVASPQAPVSPGSSPPPMTARPPSASSAPERTSDGAVTAESSAPTGKATTSAALEDVLAGRAPATTGPSPAPGAERGELKADSSAARVASSAPSEPPLAAGPPLPKTEPTPEEQREFTSRLSAAGAATGEITATLLWNSPADLDLVVRCPSGQQLDFRNPAACGGALDVDANAARGNVTDRPVENAFWPAGRAALGSYDVTVRYAPRKDEQNPRETPFQVRLIRGGQESVFKGVIRPNTAMPVTSFTVAR